MKHTDKPTKTASAPETRNKWNSERGMRQGYVDAIDKRTIPAEKPTAFGATPETYNEAINAAIAFKDEARKAQAQAAQLAEALKCAEMVLAERGIELKEITRALTNWKAAYEGGK